MIYVYRRSASAGARALVNALGGRRWWDQVRTPPRGGIPVPGDVLMCWGEAQPQVLPEDISVLNGAPLRNKLEDALTLRAAGVPTIEAYQARPAAQLVDPTPQWAALEAFATEIAGAARHRNWMRIETAPLYESFVAALQQALEAPVQPVSGEWLGRLYAHRGGNDLLNPPAAPDYWVKKEDIVREFRVHSFRGESIRAGVKIPRATALEPPHAWIRSWDGGWRISYDGRTTQQRHRLLAASAVSALGLQFGAVDIGERADGTALVLEVNRAPGLEGGTIEAYALAVRQWINRD